MFDKILTHLTEATLLGNALWRWFAVVIAAYMIHVAIRAIVGRLSKSTPDEPDSLLSILPTVLSRTHEVLLLIVALWFSVRVLLTINPTQMPVLRGATILALFAQFGMWAEEAIISFIKLRTSRNEERNAAFRTAFGIIQLGVRLFVWTIVLLLALSNFGVDVTALVAGLGVGGIAIALAVQSTLGDLMCSLSIILDKPFEVDDFIVTGDIIGTVEKIGIKSTRIRSNSGEQIIVSNSDLISSRIRNFKRMEERRAVFQIGVTYQTEPNKVREIPNIVKATIEAHDKTRFDRCHFKSFGASSLDFETVYFVLEPDYALFMDIQQSINLSLYEKFANEGIEFAYPTQTLFVEGSGSSEAAA